MRKPQGSWNVPPQNLPDSPCRLSYVPVGLSLPCLTSEDYWLSIWNSNATGCSVLSGSLLCPQSRLHVSSVFHWSFEWQGLEGLCILLKEVQIQWGRCWAGVPLSSWPGQIPWTGQAKEWFKKKIDASHGAVWQQPKVWAWLHHLDQRQVTIIPWNCIFIFLLLWNENSGNASNQHLFRALPFTCLV